MQICMSANMHDWEDSSSTGVLGILLHLNCLLQQSI